MSKFLLVASDVHSNSDAFEKLASIAESEDCIAFLYAGDLDVEDWIISDILRKRNFVFIPVAGNCDNPYSFTDSGLTPPPLYRTNTFGKLKVFLTHGHYYSSPEDLGLKSEDFNVVISGHTHKPNLFLSGKTVFMNPGSAALPRGKSFPGYGIISISENSALIENRILESEQAISSLEISLV